jgi:hypothetical protein
MKKSIILFMFMLYAVAASMVAHASPPVRPYTGGPTGSEIEAQLLKEKEALPPYPLKSPQELWQEGEGLFVKKHYGEGVVLMRASLKAFPDTQQQEKLAKFEADLARHKQAAQDKRNQGKDWQERGNMSKAAAAYQASLREWPDVLLELHVRNLNFPKSLEKNNAEIVEMAPCHILDVSAVDVLADFSMEYAPGTDKSDRRTISRVEVFGDGRVVRYSTSRSSYRQAGPPQYTTAAKRVPEMAVRRLYAATQACSFNELGSYRKKNDSNTWGTPWKLTLKADEKQHSASVLRAYVSRFEYVLSLFNNTIEGY